MNHAALRLHTVLAVVLTALAPSLANAQEPEEAETKADAPAAAPTVTPAAVDTRPACTLGEHDGIDEASASTATQIVCDAIRQAGPSAGDHFRVSIGTLGRIVVLTINKEGATAGSTVDSRQLRLQNVEEIPVAAPRIAEALVRGMPVEETQKVDNLVGEETRVPRTKGGHTKFAMGLMGITPPLDHGLTPSPGVILDLHYEAANGRLELGGDMRFGGGSNNDNTTTAVDGFFELSMGGRYYTSDTDFSPYIGGGFAWSYFHLTLPDTGFSSDDSGLGAYIGTGFEVLRTHSTHLAFGARLDLPFYAFRGSTSEVSSYCAAGCTSAGGTATSFYYAPVSLEMRLTF
jgi:Outer membrane protein beta-barrel domain